MIKIIDKQKNKDFVDAGHDENFLHDWDAMWEKYGVPPIVSAYQLVITSLAAAERDDLLGINYIKSYFQNIVPVGSEVDFSAKPQRAGIKKGGVLKLSAIANGEDSLGLKKEFSFAEKKEKIPEMPTFYEASSPLVLRPNERDLETLERLTGLDSEAVPILHAVTLSSSSLTARIYNPDTPSWIVLNRGILEKDDERKIPTYESIEVYMPSGMRSFDTKSELVLSSAIRRERKSYIIDTICRDRQGVLYGSRSYLKQRQPKVLIGAINRVLDEIENSGKHGSLAEALEKRRELRNSKQPENQPAT